MMVRENSHSIAVRVLALTFLSLSLILLIAPSAVLADTFTVGNIIAVDVSGRYAFIDLGKFDGVIKGLELDLVTDSKKVTTLRVDEVYSNVSKISYKDASYRETLTEDSEVRIKNIAPIEKGMHLGFYPDGRQKDVEVVTRSYVSGYDISENKQKSFYPQGLHMGQEVDVRSISPSSDRKLILESFIGGRYTDDKYIWPAQWTLTKLNFKLREAEEKFGFEFGDIYAYFSPYSMSQSLKGVKTFSNFESSLGQTGFQAVFGTNKSRWEAIYEDTDSRTFMRYVTGVRLEHKLTREIKFGANYVNTYEDERNKSHTGARPFHNNLFSVDGALNLFDRLNVTSEFAGAVHQPNLYTDAEQKHDKAVKVDGKLKLIELERFKTRIESGYEMAGQNFSSPSGILKTDREEYYNRIAFDIGGYISGRVGQTVLHDNLKRLLEYTTKIWRDDISLEVKPIVGRQTFALLFDGDYIQRMAGNANFDDRTAEMRIGLKDTIEKVRYWGGYTLRNRKDDVDGSKKRHVFAFDAGVRTDIEIIEGAILSPYGAFEHEVKNKGSPDVADKDVFSSIRAGCRLVLPDSTELDFTYKIGRFKDELLNQNLTRNNLDVELTHYLFKNKDRIINASYALNDWDNKNSSRNYMENLFKLEYTQRF